MEYEQNRDMDSRFTKLESALNSLKNSLKAVEERENELQSAMEKATDEIDHWKREVQGRLIFKALDTQFFYSILHQPLYLNLSS